MKNKTLYNIALAIFAIVFVGLSVNMVIRNIPLGVLSVVLVSALNVLVITILIATVNQRKKWLAIICRLLFIAWLLFAIYWGTYSANEDAVLLKTIYAITGFLTMLFGIIRNKAHG